MTANQDTRTGLRLLELESGIAANLDGASPELVDYEASRIVGQAARVAMLVRGQDVIEDERRLRKVLAAELQITGSYEAVKRALQEADLFEQKTTRTGKTVLVEKVNLFDHGNNYERLGQLWVARKDVTEKEQALVATLDSVVVSPKPLLRLDALTALSEDSRNAVLELASNAGLVDRLGTAITDAYFSPLLWDVNPVRLRKLLTACNHEEFARVLGSVQGKPGLDTTSNNDPVMVQAISAGVLPSYAVISTGGLRNYTFAPYLGDIIHQDSEKTILDKARALVACLRYGGDAATVTRIVSPLAILRSLMDESKKHRVGPHSELKAQYGMLVKKQLGRVIEAHNGRYYFELIASQDNLRACTIAYELFQTGEVVGTKDQAGAALLALVSGDVEHPLKGVRVAKKKRPARADELADLVEKLQRV